MFGNHGGFMKKKNAQVSKCKTKISQQKYLKQKYHTQKYHTQKYHTGNAGIVRKHTHTQQIISLRPSRRISQCSCFSFIWFSLLLSEKDCRRPSLNYPVHNCSVAVNHSLRSCKIQVYCQIRNEKLADVLSGIQNLYDFKFDLI